MSDFLTALGLVLVLEGCLLALFPGAMKRMWAAVMPRPDQELRVAGLAAVVLGVGVVWLLRG